MLRGQGSVTEHEHISASEAAIKKGCHLFRSHTHRTRSCCSRRRDADHAEWRGRTNALSLTLRWQRGIEPTWARLSLAAKILCPLFFLTDPWEKETGGCKGRNRTLKRKLTASAEKQDWNAVHLLKITAGIKQKNIISKNFTGLNDFTAEQLLYAVKHKSRHSHLMVDVVNKQPVIKILILKLLRMIALRIW